MADLDKAIATTARLYEVRRTARELRGEQYAADMVLFKNAIRQHASDHGVEVLTAGIQLGKTAQANGSDLAFMLVMAAVVELSEEN